MALTYGYDLNDGDELMSAPIEGSELVSRTIVPGALLVNHVPFCAVPYFITRIPVSHSYDCQCDTFIRGFRFSTMGH